jgi:arylsulfatase A-like enzyme
LQGETAGSWSGPALRAAGYQAAGFVNNPWLRPYYGFGEGYLEFRRYHGDAADGVAIASAWVRTHRLRPFFVLLHLMDPHWPYAAPAAYGEPRHACVDCEDLRTLQYRVTSEEVRGEVRRRYDAEVAYTDAEIGRLWDDLEASGVLDTSWLIVTADHGEELWEHLGFLHGHTFYDELLRVPLIVVPPLDLEDVERGAVVGAQVRLEDVGATIFDIAGLTAAHRLDGTSLRSLLPARGAPAPAATGASRPVVAGYLQQEGRHGWAVRDRGAKLIGFFGSVPYLYDLNADPHETSAQWFPLRPFLMAALARVPASMGLDVNAPPPPARATAPDADVVRELRSLGYVD